MTAFKVDVRSLPQYKSWYDEGYVTKPGDQRGCGACWAFTAASTLETLALLKGKDARLLEYSVQQLLDCDVDNFKCVGGWMFEAYEYVTKNGILLTVDYPSRYMAQVGSCLKGNQHVHFRNTGQVEKDKMTNVEMKQILQQQTIGVGIYSTGMLMSYSDGVVTEAYLSCSNPSWEVNHGVTLVGYGRVTDERVRGHCNEYWIVRNSWGQNWGSNGNFKICMDNAFSDQLPFGTCLINKYGVWPTFHEKEYVAKKEQAWDQ